MQLSKVRNFICLLVFLAFGAALAFAQGGSTGSLAGTVADPSGAVVSGAKGVVKNGETGQEFTATTSDNGTFNVPSLGANLNGFVDRLIGGWEWHGTARVQSGRPMSFGNVQLVGMTVGELQDMIEIRKGADRVITYLPDDAILNTRRAFNVDVTSSTGYSSLGAPTGRYIAPANSNGCLQGFTGQ